VRKQKPAMLNNNLKKSIAQIDFLKKKKQGFGCVPGVLLLQNL